MQIALRVKTGPHAGLEFTFDSHDNFVVGRSSSAQFRLPEKDPYFSRFHFLVEVNPPLCRLMDLDSTNGTCVNGKRVKSIELKDGDSIEAGETTIQVSLIADEDSASSIEIPEKTQVGLAELDSAAPIELKFVDAPRPAEVAATPGTDREAAEIEAKIAARPQPLPDYELIDELGRGGMGIVYRAREKRTRSPVAIKVIQPAACSSAKDIARFVREANIVKQTSHPHIVRFRDLTHVGRSVYFVMDLIPGVNGQTLLRRQSSPMPVKRAVGIVCQLLDALSAAHEMGFIHRDVKPSNLLIEERPTGDHVWLSDFGLARVYQASTISGLTTTGVIGGTFPFMAPDQISNFRDVGPAADQYSAAATLYYLLTRKYPYDLPNDMSQQILKILQEPPVPIQNRRPELSKKLSIVVHKALARVPAERFTDVNAFRAALESCTS